jgi:glutaredoxin
MKRITGVIVSLIGVLSTASLADRVFLKSGGVLNGIIKMEDNDSLIMTVSIGEMRLERDEIDSVKYSEQLEKKQLVKQWRDDKNKNEKERAELKSRNKTTYKLKPVKVFTTSWCGYCKKLEALLQANQIEYVACDIEKSVDCKNEYDSFRENYNGIPLSVIGKSVIRGYNPEAIQNALRDPSAWEKK